MTLSPWLKGDFYSYVNIDIVITNRLKYCDVYSDININIVITNRLKFIVTSILTST